MGDQGPIRLILPRWERRHPQMFAETTGAWFLYKREDHEMSRTLCEVSEEERSQIIVV
jgi:hypothetical protein